MVKSGVDFPERGDTKSESRIHGGAMALQPGKRLGPYEIVGPIINWVTNWTAGLK